MFNFKSHALKITSLFFLASTIHSANAVEINMPGLNGSLTSTLTSGFSMRASEIDCKLLDGYKTDAFSHAGARAARAANGQDATLDTIVSGSGFGCATARTDIYGNTTNQVIDLGSSQTNDGSLNFNQGDIFSASQSIFSSFTGMTDGGLAIDFSFTASVDPALEINPPAFKEFTNKAKSAFEDDVSLLDFYLSGSEDVGDTYVDYSLGRTVTSWGEATFIPIGMNGLVTNALDLSKLQSPSAGIKEALIPVETFSLATGLPDGSNLEAYYQFSHTQVGIPASGSFFGSETLGPGAAGLIANGAARYEVMKPDACPGLMALDHTAEDKDGVSRRARGFTAAGTGCNTTARDAVAWNKTDDTYKTVSTFDLAFAGLKAMTATEAAMAIAVGAGHTYATDIDGDLIDNGTDVADTNSRDVIAGNDGDAAGIAAFLTSAAGLTNPDFDAASGTVYLKPSATDGLFKEARDDGQYGFKLSKYLDDVGTGLDLSFSYANYHSKVPYIQFSMPGGMFAQDALGAYLLAAGDAGGTLDDAGVMPAGTDAAGTFELTGTAQLYSALTNAAMSAGVCEAVTKAGLDTALGGAGTVHSQHASTTAAYYRELDEGRLTYDPNLCYNWALGTSADALDASITSIPDLVATGEFRATSGARSYDTAYAASAAGVGAALIGTGARLFAAVTPINFIDYRGIFPEDLTVMSVSGSTNVGPTTVQVELAYRPNFPLATGAGNQINQLNDKNGANDALNMVAVAGAYASNTDADSSGVADATEGLTALINGVCTVSTGTPCTNSAFFYGGLGAYERSDLGDVLDANGNETTDLNSRYYSKPFVKYDVLSGTLGTTTSFNASHPVTTGLGADSSVFLSELGFVSVQGMNNARFGHVARGGWNEGVAAGTNKCLGAFGTSYTTLSTAGAAISNIGSGVVDALFGNGGYCEGKPGADDFALTYRLIGSATYNNINNSQWSFSPNFAWAHDPKGYAPSSLGGFVEGRQTLSLGANFSRNDLTVSTSYTDYMGDELSQLSADKDYLSLAVSYAF